MTHVDPSDIIRHVNTLPWFGRNQASVLSPEDRYWEKVDLCGPHECWPWLASTNAGGYGRFDKRLGYELAHRYAWFLAYGDPGLMCVLHKCDNPSCQNPDHLFLGTRDDNNKDRMRKGRGRGAPWYNHNKAKLNPDRVALVRRLYATNRYTLKQLATQFGVSFQLVSQIVRREIWK